MSAQNLIVKFIAIPTEHARHLQSGGCDENGLIPEKMISDGDGFPCRHCLKGIEKGEEVLVISYRPFPEKQPYAESGPIFLHSKTCVSHNNNGKIPDNIKSQGITLIRGYNSENRIVYGTGKAIKSSDIEAESVKMFEADNIAYIHARSAANNCFTCRIERA
ncbi:hypothetical protein WH96_12830 [Kiloniella spongiae]|uniref:DUF1203 domain-containing protein n=1 Tax=Kiloniella spongiae TaxID=1489064 RepID=A0A0H2MTR5_9PROT|nr:DUF1203 domain-containing protein [Kiloniella spongiae]KLN60075.1 hypothetical protein WH96_12830 [Kiloniella spongiae]